jgi:hypothetical protein
MATSKAQYTIRGVRPAVDQALRRLAKEKHLSLNGYLVHELERLAEEASAPLVHHDLDFLAGSMSDGAAVDRALRDFTEVDIEAWK